MQLAPSLQIAPPPYGQIIIIDRCGGCCLVHLWTMGQPLYQGGSHVKSWRQSAHDDTWRAQGQGHCTQVQWQPPVTLPDKTSKEHRLASNGARITWPNSSSVSALLSIFCNVTPVLWAILHTCQAISSPRIPVCTKHNSRNHIGTKPADRWAAILRVGLDYWSMHA